MNPALIEIVLHAVKEKYVSEKAFYTTQLGISAQSWDRWKKGEQGLRYDNIQILATLFTDYEWMLVQKVVRNCELFPEVIKDPVKEYTFLKFQIAKTWMQHNMARIEWHQTEANEVDSPRKSNATILQLVADYHLWGYNDIIELRLPGIIRQQIESNEVCLLEWVDNQSEQLKGSVRNKE
ncbi:hypothetical protein [Dolosicoccus paucivorans]|uniref:hypothetical protein n=1 Tax=Dolosicoccus paucivorans TaxID=84521 RepID=UPI0008916EEF|nr:hypothetical protein [Dolosicoccus paucivorans]SDI59021.1 hypothetical protein SAMN04487994_102411 [Dolosicoccus paucivorans]